MPVGAGRGSFQLGLVGGWWAGSERKLIGILETFLFSLRSSDGG